MGAVPVRHLSLHTLCNQPFRRSHWFHGRSRLLGPWLPAASSLLNVLFENVPLLSEPGKQRGLVPTLPQFLMSRHAMASFPWSML